MIDGEGPAPLLPYRAPPQATFRPHPTVERRQLIDTMETEIGPLAGETRIAAGQSHPRHRPLKAGVWVPKHESLAAVSLFRRCVLMLSASGYQRFGVGVAFACLVALQKMTNRLFGLSKAKNERHSWRWRMRQGVRSLVVPLLQVVGAVGASGLAGTPLG